MGVDRINAHVYTDATRVHTRTRLYTRPGGLCGFHFNRTDEKKKPPIPNAACSMEALAKGLCLQSLAGIGWFCSNTARTPRVLGTGCKRL